MRKKKNAQVPFFRRKKNGLTFFLKCKTCDKVPRLEFDYLKTLECETKVV